jgi:hypothetical protein
MCISVSIRQRMMYRADSLAKKYKLFRNVFVFESGSPSRTGLGTQNKLIYLSTWPILFNVQEVQRCGVRPGISIWCLSRLM